MTAQQRQNLINLLKEKQFLVDIQTIESGVDNLGFPTFETKYINPPKNYKLVRLIEPYKVAILEDLSPTNETI